jgi:hypothetical protein
LQQRLINLTTFCRHARHATGVQNMSITQETAIMIDMLATAASKIGSTAASSKINALICEILPDPKDDESVAESLRQDNIALQEELASLQISARIGAENLEIVRGKLKEISLLATETLADIDTAENVDLADDLRKIVELSDDSPV